MTINASNLVFRLSGGAANTTPDLSLGGAVSSTVMQAQQATAINMAGVGIAYSGGLTPGSTHSIRHTIVSGTHYFELKDGTDVSYGPAVAVGESGTIYLAGQNRGAVGLTITFGALGSVAQTEQFSVTNVKNNLFDDVTKTDALNGKVEYRCIYLYNNHPTESFLQVALFGYGQAGNPAAAGDKFWVAADIAGEGNGSTSGVASPIATEVDVPVGAVFSSPVLATPLVLGSIGPQKARAVWLRRDVPPLLFAATPDDYASFGVKVIY